MFDDKNMPPTSIVSYPERGEGGNNKYRAIAPLIEHLIDHSTLARYSDKDSSSSVW